VQDPNAEIGVKDFPAHIGDKFSTGLTDGLVVGLDGFELIQEVLRDDRFAEVGDPFELGPGLDGHEPGDHRHRDPRGPDLSDPIDKYINIIEHLGEDEVRASVDLLLEINRLLFS
jgi:hypothetical protein